MERPVAAQPVTSGAGTTADHPNTAIRLENVVVEFPDAKSGHPRRVLDKINITSEPGEFLVLVGRSGCGKTTVLNLLSGLLRPTSGTVEVLESTPRAARQRMGYMFARDALMPWRKARTNVELGLEVKGVSRAERRRRAEAMLDRVHLLESGDMWPWQLSQGMRQRVALARTWAPDPALILMDEPFAALDAQTKVSVRAEFMRIWEEGRPSVVFVTHDLSEALLLGDRVIMLSQGRIEVDLRVPFSHPRDVEELPYTKEFVELERDLWQRLK
jgi:NitT/TauT family transport system ATP-binding protein